MKKIIRRMIGTLMLTALTVSMSVFMPVEVHAAGARPKSILAVNEARNNEAALKVLTGGISFSGKKIACLGDSLTYGLDGSTNEPTDYSYPFFLQLLTGAEVTNLGYGSSTIGSSNVFPMFLRYKEIPTDTDYIVVFGGINDSFYVTKEQFGTFEERAIATFVGELNYLFYGLRTEYPKSEIIVINPPKSLWQYNEYKRGRGKLVPQARYAEAIRTLSTEYGFHLIDLYEENILNSFNASVRKKYVPDGLHPNAAGYHLLANLVAARMIEIEQTKAETP